MKTYPKTPLPNKHDRSLFEDFQILSIKSVEEPDWEYVIRKVCRIFSTTFHTPLTECEELPLEYMLQHIYENLYESMEPQEFAITAEKVLTKKEDDEEEVEKENEDDAWAAEIAQELEDERREDLKRKKELTNAPQKLPDPKDLPPDVNIRFDDENL